MTPGPREWTYDEVCDALDRAAPHEVVVHVGTSGSTGTPKVARLTAGALTASARGTVEVIGGPGQWLLATPATHIAGIQVLVRSALAGIPPVTLDPGGFTSARFSSAASRLVGAPCYTSLVPTQVARLLEDAEGRAALARFDAVLVGGAAVPDTLRAAARSAGARVIATYGMSESAGGCVYDGRPLPGARVRVLDADEHGVGVIELSGPMLALGYAEGPEQTARAFRTAPDGSRWFRTDDLGRIDEGVLTVLGRHDDVINTGGLKVAPHVVEAAVAEAFPDLARRCVVVGLPDPRWGEAVTLVVEGDPSPGLALVRSALRAHLSAPALPTRLERVDVIPVLGPGKPDRRAVRAHVRGLPSVPSSG